MEEATIRISKLFSVEHSLEVQGKKEFFGGRFVMCSLQRRLPFVFSRMSIDF